MRDFKLFLLDKLSTKLVPDIFLFFEFELVIELSPFWVVPLFSSEIWIHGLQNEAT